VLNLRSFERALHAIDFFDQHIPRTVAHVTAVTVSNRLLSVAEAAALGSLDQYFERADVVVKDPASLLHDVEDIVSRTPDLHERFVLLDRYITDRAKAPVPAMERIPLSDDEEGIRSVEALLAPHQVIAMHHWRGNTNYTRHDLMQDMRRAGALPTGETSTMSMPEPSVDASLTAQLCALIRSDDYQDWLQAWELMRDTMPEGITTFDALEAQFALDVHDCSVTDMFYTLEMELHNEGLADARLTAIRAEFARWVYTHFTEENELNLGNFRGYEAESLWALDQREQAEALFQELTETYPNFAWGYIWWGDQYWMSDWSYEHGPDYDRAESLYRQALAQPDVDDRDGVQDRLDDLYEEREHPEKRERIKQARLQNIQRRKHLE
jgi:hypothetical protein